LPLPETSNSISVCLDRAGLLTGAEAS
jgi:hypothetical protein